LKHLRQNTVKAAAAGNSKPPFLDPNEDAPVPQQVLFSYDLFLQLRKNPNSCKRAPIGLTNLGNNCYANAALQCLLYTKPLRAYLDQGLHSKDCNRPHDRDWCLLCVLSVSLELSHTCAACTHTHSNWKCAHTLDTGRCGQQDGVF
jgi:ubiquitin C-terminal hydrolase